MAETSDAGGGEGTAAPAPATEAGTSQPGVGQSASEEDIWSRVAEVGPEDEDATGEPPAEVSEEEEGKAPAGGEGTEEEELEAKGEQEGEGEAEDENAPLMEQPEPEWLGKVLGRLEGLPKLRNQIKETFFAERAYREQFPRVAEARQYKEIAPTLEDLTAIRDKAQNTDNLDYGFEKDRKGLVNNLAANDPRNFHGLVSELPDYLADYVNPQTGERDTRFFKAAQAGFTRHLISNLEMKAKALAHADPDSTEAEGLSDLAEGLKRALGIGREGETRMRDPESERLFRENQSLRARAEQGAQQERGHFILTINDRFNDALVKKADVLLDAYWKRAGRAISGDAKERISDEILSAVSKEVMGNPALQSQVRTAMQGRPLDEGLRKELLRVMLGRADHYLRLHAQKTLNSWGRIFKSGNKEDLDRRTAAASRRDAGTGGHAAGRSRGFASGKPVSQMSPAEKEKYYQGLPTDEDIFAKLSR